MSALLVIINAHLAFHHENRIAVIASHCQRTYWLYPSPTGRRTSSVEDATAASDQQSAESDHSIRAAPADDANKYLPFRKIEDAILTNLRALFASTTIDEFTSTHTTLLAGALTLALSYINKATLTASPGSSAGTTTGTDAGPNAASASQLPSYNTAATATAAAVSTGNLTSRILVLSTSAALASQYIPLMNLTFAAQRLRIPLDILKLAGGAVLLQQASFTTSGLFLTPLVPATATPNPQGLLQYLFQAFLPDAPARRHLVPPTDVDVDFRAACFCHRRVVDEGFVCSICLSIFCKEGAAVIRERGDASAPGTGPCLTCGTKLTIGSVANRAGGDDGRRRKKKKKGATNGDANGVASSL